MSINDRLYFEQKIKMHQQKLQDTVGKEEEKILQNRMKIRKFVLGGQISNISNLQKFIP